MSMQPFGLDLSGNCPGRKLSILRYVSFWRDLPMKDNDNPLAEFDDDVLKAALSILEAIKK